MTHINNPFRDLALDERFIAYVNFTQVEDVEAVEWVVEAFWLKRKRNITFNN